MTRPTIDFVTPLRIRAEETAARHAESALPYIAGDYLGKHWLASFALLALDPWPGH